MLTSPSRQPIAMTGALEFDRVGSHRTASPGEPVLVVGIGGTTRAGSSSEVALRTAMETAEAAGAATRIFTGPDLDFPMYAPERPERTEAARQFVETVRRADAVILASPGYHGSVSGLIKNALDYLEDMRADARPYLEGRAVGCIAVAHGWQATGSTLAALRSIVHALRGWPTPFGASVNSAMPVFHDGACVDAAVAAQLALVGQQVVDFVRAQRGSSRQTAS